MSMKEKKEQWKQEIIARLEKENLMWFIVDEIRDSLNYLNPYKVKNVYENLDRLITELKEINENYIRKLSNSLI